MDFRNMNVLVAGFSIRSGAGAARLLASLGARVSVWDNKTREQLNPVFEAVEDVPLHELFLGEDSKDIHALLKGMDLIVISPGVPASLPIFRFAARKGIKVISEVELAWLVCPAKWICVTGTDGKTTVTTIIGRIFRKAGMNVLVAGNIGVGLCDALSKAKRRPEYIVAELSSFQLETIDTLRPLVSVLLNITPDHLDRYPSMTAYGRAKLRICMNQTGEDTLIINADDRFTRKLMKGHKPGCRILKFSRKSGQKQGAYIEDGVLKFAMDGKVSDVIQAARLRIKGEHNKENALAASAVALSAGVPLQSVSSVLATFKGVEHRCEPVKSFKGRDFINDSKATTLNAVRMALLSMEKPVVLMMGGRGKGDDFRRIEELVKKKVRLLVAFGEAGREISKRIRMPGTLLCPGMSCAFRRAWKESRTGEVILLSPGCTSYDEFRDFEHRGRVFKSLVRRLK